MIVGGSIGGKVTALFLKSIPWVKSIVVLEATPSPSSTISLEHSVSHLHTGLWGPSMHLLDSIGLYKGLESNLQPVFESGYRSTIGDWLARPTVGLQAPLGDGPSLAFIKNEVLMKELDEHLSSDSKIEVRYNTVVNTIEADKERKGTVYTVGSLSGEPFKKEEACDLIGGYVHSHSINQVLLTLVLVFSTFSDPSRCRWCLLGDSTVVVSQSGLLGGQGIQCLSRGMSERTQHPLPLRSLSNVGTKRKICCSACSYKQ